jgi:hypothetical protein
MAKPYQVFIGCPFRKAIRKNYDRLKAELERESPLHFVLADTGSITSTDYLLEHITGLITESDCCVFDASGGNPNVSLEVGIAHALPADFILTFNSRKPRTSEQRRAEAAAVREGEVRPIIADLQGRNRIEYKTYAALKSQLLSRYLIARPFFQRWRSFRAEYSAFADRADAVFDDLRRSGRALRPRVAARLAGSGINVDEFLGALARHKLVDVRRGRRGGIYYPKK